MASAGPTLANSPLLRLVGWVVTGIVAPIALGAFTNPCLGMFSWWVFVTAWVIWLNRSARVNWVLNVRGDNPYEILGVSPSADVSTIRRAFRALEHEYHPDAVPEERRAEATAVFVRLNQAYEVLTNTEMRYEYDSLLRDGEELPPFEELYRRIKDVEKHPAYAEYDAVYGSRKDLPAPLQDREPDPPPRESPSMERPAVEVEMPDAVREALGLPPPESPRTVGDSR